MSHLPIFNLLILFLVILNSFEGYLSNIAENYENLYKQIIEIDDENAEPMLRGDSSIYDLSEKIFFYCIHS